MLSGPALELMGRLRPDEGLGDAVDDFVAFVHAAWRFWCDGKQMVVRFDEAATRALCHPGQARARRGAPPMPRRSRGIFRSTLGWYGGASPATRPMNHSMAGSPRAPGRSLRVVACFGLHSARPGLSVVVAEGARAASRLVARMVSLIFSPMMPGGDIAGLHAVAAPEELLLLAWRAEIEEAR